MKIIAALVSALYASNGHIQAQGTRPDGVTWSATRTPNSLAYQENGESLVALGGPVSGKKAKGRIDFAFQSSVMTHKL